MSELGLSQIVKRFHQAVAQMAYTDLSIADDLAIDSGVTGTLSAASVSLFRAYSFSTGSFVNQMVNSLTELRQEQQGSATEKDLVNCKDEEVQNLILLIKSSKAIAGNLGIANRLLELFDSSKEEEPHSTGMATGSLRCFYKFLERNSTLKLPAITLSPDGNIYASWRGDEGRLFSVHFLADGDVRFVIFRPNRRHPRRKTRVSGATTFDVLLEEVSSYSVDDWISR